MKTFKNEEDLKGVWYASSERENFRIQFNKKYCRIKYPDYVLQHCDFIEPKLVLDAGCGTGALLIPLADINSGINVGLDISKGLIEYLKGKVKNNTILMQGNVVDLPFPNNYFNCIFCSFVLYHVGNIQAAINQFYRCLRDDGQLMITTKSIYSKIEMDNLLNKYFKKKKLNVRIPKNESHFSAENGMEYIKKSDFTVEQYDIQNEMKIETTNEYYEYLMSTISFNTIIKGLGKKFDKADFLCYLKEEDLKIVDRSSLFIARKK